MKLGDYLPEVPEMAKQMGHLGRNFVKEKFSWDVIAKKFMRIFEANIKKTV